MSQLRQAVSRRFRSRRSHVVRGFLSSVARPGQQLRVIDLGGSVAYWQVIGIDFLRGLNAHITLINLAADNFGTSPPAASELFEFVTGDACAVNAADRSFDLAHSNSVIEHVGDWGRMVAFAGEMRRLAPAYFLQTPNRHFLVDPHFPKMPMIHWMPRPMQAALHRAIPLAASGRARDWKTALSFVDGVNLLSRNQLATLFPDGECVAEQVAGFAKSFMVMRRIAGQAN